MYSESTNATEQLSFICLLMCTPNTARTKTLHFKAILMLSGSTYSKISIPCPTKLNTEISPSLRLFVAGYHSGIGTCHSLTGQPCPHPWSQIDAQPSSSWVLSFLEKILPFPGYLLLLAQPFILLAGQATYSPPSRNLLDLTQEHLRYSGCFFTDVEDPTIEPSDAGQFSFIRLLSAGCLWLSTAVSDRDSRAATSRTSWTHNWAQAKTLVSLERTFLYLAYQNTFLHSQVLAPVKRPLTASLLVDLSSGGPERFWLSPKTADDIESDPFTVGRESSCHQNIDGGGPQVVPVICTRDSTAPTTGPN
jgi:hypothetical protein